MNRSLPIFLSLLVIGLLAAPFDLTGQSQPLGQSPLPHNEQTLPDDHSELANSNSFPDYYDTFYDLTCSSEGFKGYFSLSRWAVEIRNGDGGVDVTGAPDVVSVEGADSTRLEIKPSANQEVALRIVLPAEGYLFFNLVKFGSSNFSSLTQDELEIRINGIPVEVHLLAGGGIHVPLAHQEDEFELRLRTSDPIIWSDFKMITNSPGVIERVYQQGATKIVQLIAVDRSTLAHLFLPERAIGQEWPFLDDDRNTMTTHDQIPLYPDQDYYNLRWQDTNDLQEGQPWIKRRWHIVDGLANNEVIYDQWWEPTSSTDR